MKGLINTYKGYNISLTHEYHKGEAFVTVTIGVKLTHGKLACKCVTVVTDIGVHDVSQIKYLLLPECFYR